jgi:hypothetical protein
MCSSLRCCRAYIASYCGGNMWNIYSKYFYFSLFVVIGLVFPVALTVLTPNDISVFTRDVFSIAKIPPIAGFLSNIGAFVWCASLSIIIFTIFSIHRNNSVRVFSFIYCSAFITGWILIDDFFQIHDYWFVLIGISEMYAYIGILLFITVYFILFFRIIINTRYLLLLLALGFLSLSVAFDLMQHFYDLGRTDGRWFVFLEDAPKWIGACFWAAYYFSTARRILNSDAARQQEVG